MRDLRLIKKGRDSSQSGNIQKHNLRLFDPQTTSTSLMITFLLFSNVGIFRNWKTHKIEVFQGYFYIAFFTVLFLLSLYL